MIFPPPSLLSTTEEDDSHDRFALHAFQLGLITIVPPTTFSIQVDEFTCDFIHLFRFLFIRSKRLRFTLVSMLTRSLRVFLCWSLASIKMCWLVFLVEKYWLVSFSFYFFFCYSHVIIVFCQLVETWQHEIVTKISDLILSYTQTQRITHVLYWLEVYKSFVFGNYNFCSQQIGHRLEVINGPLKTWRCDLEEISGRGSNLRNLGHRNACVPITRPPCSLDFKIGAWKKTHKYVGLSTFFSCFFRAQTKFSPYVNATRVYFKGFYRFPSTGK